MLISIDDIIATHDPDDKAPVDGVLPENVTDAVSIKIADTRNLPFKSYVGDVVIGKNRGAVHEPDANFASRCVSPKDILPAISVEIARVTDEIRNCRRCWGRACRN